MEAITDQKGYADLKSEFGQMRADISANMNFLDMADKKHKSHNDTNKQGKAHAGVANIKNSKRSVKASIATFFPRRSVDQEDSAASDSDDQGQVEYAILPESRLHPRPSLLFNRFMDKIPAPTW
jgi:hypothetical protein